MTPAEAIRSLDGQLQEHGQDVVLRKGNTTVGEKTVRAFVRGYKPAELIGGLKQGDKKVSISATGLAGFGEPADIAAVFFDSKPRSVQGEPEIIRLAGQLVRVNLTVRG
jgi:hypothetical protein